MPGTHSIEAQVRFFTSDEGGRRGPVASGYRGQFHYEEQPSNVHDAGWWFPDIPDGTFITLGRDVRVLVTFIEESWNAFHAERMNVGTKFQIQEGAKIVARGFVTNLDADGQQLSKDFNHGKDSNSG